ncbi:crossover junction endodeoxyribonuclease RuvC [Cerasicoccus frondis]|uniref:crossover junction endodeoxyribonuclease RuvC n=1 Tax=Cerasicoccus frondis TaxID=490090 RepID=UPI0028529CC9|nr:crossover junction endodeoxyribonuclease RuvC [Cerasicoccus frondis]
MGRKSARSLWSAKLAGQGVSGAVSSAEIEAQFAARREPFDGTVLGIDPSLRGAGFAVVKFTPGAPAKLLGSLTLKLKPALSQSDCLGEIARAVSSFLARERISCVSLEQTIYVQNFQTAQIMGMARGAAIAPAAMQGVPIFEYAPLRIKQAVVGYGRASKEQVAAMVRQHLKLMADLPSDEADAAAAAICHAMTGQRS